MPTVEDALAEKLYAAVVALLAQKGVFGLMSVGNDAGKKIPWESAGTKTQDIMRGLAANLTAQGVRA
jgi:hypothetical protein